jgi:hypothetical protein
VFEIERDISLIFFARLIRWQYFDDAAITHGDGMVAMHNTFRLYRNHPTPEEKGIDLFHKIYPLIWS